MSEQLDLSSPLRTESAPAPKELITSAGSLRALRVSKGFSTEDVAVRLKFSARHIEALESESFDTLPQGLALRSMVRSYAKLLGIDSKPLEASLHSRIGSVQGGIANHTSIRTLGAHHVEHVPHSGAWAWVVLIILVVVAVFGVAIWQGLLPASLVPDWIEALFK
jgi:cytoskeletal protein RodZ